MSVHADLLPSDITGFNIFSQRSHEFEFREGPVFADVLLADEINRATPRSQSALLEAMAERQVTVDAQRYSLSDQFFVIATQNPVDQHGTYPLPEAQLDRFAMKLSVGYPERADEMQMLQDAILQASRTSFRRQLTGSRARTTCGNPKGSGKPAVASIVQDYLVRLDTSLVGMPALCLD